MEDWKQLQDEEMQAASMTECTGLMPALPQSEAEDESSAELYAVHRAKRLKRKKK